MPAIIKFTGEEFSAIHGDGVYTWSRGEEYLYIGCSGNMMLRVGGHNIIDRTEDVMPEDSIVFHPCPDYDTAAILEDQLIQEHQPKYNRRMSRYSLEDRSCPMCQTIFTPVRWWQKFCSASCRQGKRPS